MSRLDAAGLAARLRDLPVTVEAAFALAIDVRAPVYPGGMRPSGVLYVSGSGCVATGECVAFDPGEQERFAREAPALVIGRRGRLGEVVASLARSTGAGEAGTPDETGRFRRAAIEGALIDLALRQAGLSLRDLTGAGATAMDFVVSFEACADPASRVREMARLHPPGTRFKVDVDPAWSEAAIEALAATGAVAILDFKGRGDASLCTRLAARFPAALVEDPPPRAPLPAPRVVRDRPLHTVADVEAAVAAGHGINIKAPRLGGFLAALDGLAAAGSARGPVLIGGMFEVGVGRRQARALAALFTAAAPNDLAPLPIVERPASARPLPVPLDRPGFA